MVGIPLMVLLLTNAAPSLDDLQAKAEASFREGTQLMADPQAADQARATFAAAARRYAQLAAAGCSSAALYRNLGNAYLLADDLPHAILSYRRGLHETPNDLDLRFALHYAREQVVFPAHSALGRPPLEHRPPWLPRLPGWWTWLAFGLYTLGCLAAARWWMVRRAAWLMASVSAFAALSSVIVGLAWQGWEDRQEEMRPPVVIAKDDVLLRRGNGAAYPPRAQTPLNRGVEARRLFERGDWLQIELSGGAVGWVRQSDVLTDDGYEPRPSP